MTSELPGAGEPMATAVAAVEPADGGAAGSGAAGGGAAGGGAAGGGAAGGGAADRAGGDRAVDRTLVAVVALVGVTAVWGSTFFLLKGVVSRVPPADFLMVRFWLAGVALWLLSPGSVHRLSPRVRRNGLLLGLVYGGAQLLQTWGLAHTSAAVSGFVTGMYVVLTPVLAGVLLRQRILPVVWAAVALATSGLAVLALEGITIGSGEALTLASAGLYALHIVGLGAWSTGGDAFGLAVLQTLAIATVCSLAALPGGVRLPVTGPDWAVLVYMALVAGAAAMVAQTWAQAHLPPTRAAIVMTTEPVWAGGFAVTLGSERVGARLLIGGGLVVAAMFLAEFGPRRPRRPRRDHAASA